MKTLRAVALGLVLCVALPTPALADVGVPMIFVTFPAMVAALIPVTVVEGLYLARALSLPKGNALKVSALANITSTLVGIPITWFILVVVQMVTGGGAALGLNTIGRRFLAVTWQAPWLVPYESDLYWMVPGACLVLLIPFYLASCYIEGRVAKYHIVTLSPAVVEGAVDRANLLSYGLLVLVTAGWFLSALR